MSSHMSILPRRSLTARQAQLVERLLDEAAAELESVGYEELSIRSVALRAGVSPATAYTYLASKEHLFAELFCRLLVTEPVLVLTGSDPAARLQQTVRHLAAAIATAPGITVAATKSLLGSDPQVQRIRLAIGALIVGRFTEALGDGGDPCALDAISFAFFGALLEAGMGFLNYAELGDRLDPVVAVIMEERT